MGRHNPDNLYSLWDRPPPVLSSCCLAISYLWNLARKKSPSSSWIFQIPRCSAFSNQSHNHKQDFFIKARERRRIKHLHAIVALSLLAAGVSSSLYSVPIGKDDQMFSADHFICWTYFCWVKYAISYWAITISSMGLYYYLYPSYGISLLHFFSLTRVVCICKL